MQVAERIKLPVEGSKVAVQGFGNVGNEAAYLFNHAGAKIVAVQDHTGTIFNAEGLNVKALQKYVAEQLDIPVGVYYHFAHNMHLYNNNKFHHALNLYGLKVICLLQLLLHKSHH